MRGWCASRSWSALPRCASPTRRRSRKCGSGPSIRSSASIRAPRLAKAGHHRRHRRQEPRQARPVAVAADADRGPDHQPDQSRRRRDRLRRGVLGARPAQSRDRGAIRCAIWTRQPAPSCASCRATTRFSPKRSGARAWCWARPDFARSSVGARQDAAGDRALPRSARSVEPFPVRISRPVAQHSRAREGRPPAAACSRIRPERDGIIRRVPMIMRAQGEIMPSLSLEILRVVTGTPTHPDQGRQGRHQQHRRQGLPRSRPTRTASSGFISRATIPRSTSPRPTCSTAACRPSKIKGKLVLIGTSAVGLQRHQDHAGVGGHAGRRDPRPGARKRADAARCFRSRTMRIARRIPRRAGPRHSGDHLRAEFGPVTLVGIGRAVRRRADRSVLVLLCAVPAADRFHLSAAVDHRDLPDADLRELRPRAGAAQADPLGVRPVSVAGAGRAARAVAGKARARRRGARDDHHVLRRARLHHDLGNLQARSAGPDSR